MKKDVFATVSALACGAHNAGKITVAAAPIATPAKSESQAKEDRSQDEH